MIKRYKVIKEYDRFYLATDENGFKECFPKVGNRVDKDGYITVRETIYPGGKALPSEKVNKNFNGGRFE